MNVHPYLNFAGNAEEAMRFYAQALGGTLTEVHRFGSMPMDGFELSPEQQNMVMHVGLGLADGQMIMASDTLPGMGPAYQLGNHISVSLHPDSREQADRIFQALAAGGTVDMPIADQFWGDYYGSLTDRFGVQWMVNYSPQAAASA
jgi:PhnB protein